MFVYIYIYISRYVQPSHFCCLPATSLHGTEMAAARELFEYSLRSTSSEYYIEQTKATVYAAKLGRQATTAVARFIHCSVRQVNKEGLKHSTS